MSLANGLSDMNRKFRKIERNLNIYRRLKTLITELTSFLSQNLLLQGLRGGTLSQFDVFKTHDSLKVLWLRQTVSGVFTALEARHLFSFKCYVFRFSHFLKSLEGRYGTYVPEYHQLFQSKSR